MVVFFFVVVAAVDKQFEGSVTGFRSPKTQEVLLHFPCLQLSDLYCSRHSARASPGSLTRNALENTWRGITVYVKDAE